jgi:hypothetical protein
MFQIDSILNCTYKKGEIPKLWDGKDYRTHFGSYFTIVNRLSSEI